MDTDKLYKRIKALQEENEELKRLVMKWQEEAIYYKEQYYELLKEVD